MRQYSHSVLWKEDRRQLIFRGEFRIHKEEVRMNYLEQNVKKLSELCRDGYAGEYCLPIRQISLPLTNKCNSYCIMCNVCSKDYSNHTAYNDPPMEKSLKDIKRLLAPKRTLWEKLHKVKKQNDDPISFMFGSAESLLNGQCYQIFQYIKSVYPNSKINLISNGTIPPRPTDIVKYIDRIGFSVDGCTAETYEYLRTPCKFEHAVKTIRQWDEAAAKCNKNFTFGFSTVVSAKNIHELAGIVELASSYKHIDSVYVQPIVLHESRMHLAPLLLTTLDLNEAEQCLEEARAASKRTGVRIDGINSVIDALQRADLSGEESPTDTANSKYCRYMWNGIVLYNDNRKLQYLCCYMEKEKNEELIKRYRLHVHGRVEDTYNAKEYWKLRGDLLDGKLTAYCEGCSLCNTGYEELKASEVNMDEYFYL